MRTTCTEGKRQSRQITRLVTFNKLIIHSFIHSFFHSFIHSFIQSFFHLPFTAFNFLALYRSLTDTEEARKKETDCDRRTLKNLTDHKLSWYRRRVDNKKC